MRLTLIMSFPLFLVIILGWFVMPYSYGYLKETLSFGFLTSIFTGLSLIVKHNKYGFWVAVISSFLLSILSFIKLSFYVNYGVRLSASALFVIFETNGTEASDFLSNYFNYKVIGLLIIVICLFFTSILFLKLEKNKSVYYLKPIQLLIFLGIFFSAFCIQRSFSNENLILKSINSYKDYRIAKSNLKETLAKKDTKNITNVKSIDKQQTYVIIIGESTSNWHMQLYGYDRETNPLLNEIRNELLVFNNVITPNVHTIVALDRILTLSDFNEPNKDINASIVQLANKAGFETFWISNQKPVGIHESIPTIIGSAAHNQNFISTDNSSNDIYDESLLPYLQIALDNTANKKLIFLHLIGSHSRYNRRYPKEYAVFKNETNTAFKHSKSKIIINEYDNAIRYNDAVVRNIIEKVRLKNENSYVVYFSDHGDEVYDTFDFVGHNEFHGTKPMYEVPFIAWFSDKYKATNPDFFNIENITDRPYILEDFIHSFSEISNITFDKFDTKKSIFNSNFQVRKRIIKKDLNYDTWKTTTDNED